MPSSRWQGPLNEGPQSKSGVDDLDAVPMDAEDLTAVHEITIERKMTSGWQDIRNRASAGLQHLDAAAQVKIEVLLEAYPEAVWRRGDAAAASRNIHAIGGIEMKFASVPEGIPTQQIPITTLIDEGPRAPNPFTVRRGGHGLYQGLARRAVDLLKVGAASDARGVAAVFLARDGLFEEQRKALDLDDGGLDALGLQTLARRTTPPVVASLSTGLTMDRVLFESPPEREVVTPKAPVPLVDARLRAVASLPAAVARASAASMRTVVSGADDVPRVAPPMLSEGTAAQTLGARLVRIPTTGLVPPTRPSRAAYGGKTGRKGRPISKRRAARVDAMEKAAMGEGQDLAPGAVQHWDIPPHDRSWTVHLSGDGVGVRLLCLGRGSRVIADVERVISGSWQMSVPDGSHQVVIMALGSVPGAVTPGFGAVSRAFSPGGVAAVGWQADSTIFVVTPSVLASRGSRIRLGGPSRAEEGRTAIAGAALAARAVIETRLPAATGTLVVLADRVGTGTADAPQIGVVGATLAPPLRESNGRRHTWLYRVEPSEGRNVLHATLALGEGWTPGGVLLVPGGPEEVGSRLNGRTVPRFVSDGPIAARGSLRLSLSSAPRSEA
jgi:hypothetical protein